MENVDYKKVLVDLIAPLLDNPDALEISIKEDNKHIKAYVKVDPEDLGRLIGRHGRIINSIRTLAYTCAARNNKHIDIEIDEEPTAEQTEIASEEPAEEA